MALTKFTRNVNNIQALSDRPNETDGLDANELKARFDKAGADIKTYLNDILTDELDAKFLTMTNSLQQAREEEYPIGRVIEFFDDLDHSNYLGFNWVRCHTGRVPVGLSVNEEEFNAIGKTGGEKKHTLTVAEMPKHSHQDSGVGGARAVNGGGAGWTNFVGTVSPYYVNEAGDDRPHNILQPYEVVSFWKRVS